MNLTVDIGNTSIKAGLFDNGEVVDTFRLDRDAEKGILSIIEANPSIDAAISVATGEAAAIEEMLRGKIKKYIRFDHSIGTPVRNLYTTPHTLGYDRLAAAVGAHTIYSSSYVMVVDFGTAITIDIVTPAGEFLGGNISPGATMRLRALKYYTSSLPLIEFNDMTEGELVGNSTASAICSGVINGVIFEIEGYIERFSKIYSPLKVIFTGGEAIFFAKRLKSTIFAANDLILFGLNRILRYNES